MPKYTVKTSNKPGLLLLAGLVCLSLSACDLPAMDLKKDTPPPAATTQVLNPYTSLSPFSPAPGASTGAFGLNLATYLDEEPQNLDARIARLEIALIAIQNDLYKLARVTQDLAIRQPSLDTTPLMPSQEAYPTGSNADMATPPTVPVLPATAPPQALNAPITRPENDEAPAWTPPPAPEDFNAQNLEIPVHSPAETAIEERMAPEETLSPLATPPPAQAAETATPALGKKIETRKIDTSGPPTVKRLRLGEHGTQTRMVLDLTKKAGYSYDIDTMEDLLIIELPGVKWDTRKDWKASDHPLISSYTATGFNGGTRLIVGLKNDAKVIKELTIEPDSSAYYRIVLDFGQ